METSDFQTDITSSIHTDTFQNKEYAGVSFEHSRSGGRHTKKFIGCDFKGSFLMTVYDIGLEFENCSFEFVNTSKLEVRGSTAEHLKFKNCKIIGNVDIGSSNIIEVLNSSVRGTLRIIDGHVNKIKIKKEPINNSKIQKISLGKIGTCPNLELLNLNVDIVEFNEYIPAEVSIREGHYGSILLNSVENLKNFQLLGNEDDGISVEIGLLQMHSLNLEGDILLKLAKIKHWDISPFNLKEGSMRLQSVIIEEKATITQSNLSQVQFNDVNFYTAQLVLDWTFLSDTRFANIVWPKGHLVESEMKTETKEDKVLMLRAKTEVYRQLKKVSKGESNNIEALKFYRNEMMTYWERVKLDKTESRANRFLIRIDRGTSNFGQSYLYPICWMLGIHLVLCSGIWILEAHAEGILFQTANFDLVKGMKEFFTWLVPIYKTPDTWSDASAILGVFIRILSGFFIYHIVKASRKFGRI